jgi:hypothetical protein
VIELSFYIVFFRLSSPMCWMGDPTVLWAGKQGFRGRDFLNKEALGFAQVKNERRQERLKAKR